MYTPKYKIKDITEIENNYKIIFQAVGEPVWPFGETKVRLTLINKNGKEIKSFDEYISNDGATAQKENIKFN